MRKFAVIFLALLIFPAFAQAYDNDAYIFYFSNLGDGGALKISGELMQMGFETYAVKDANAESIVFAMDKAAVFSYVGHGKAGRLYCTGESEVSAYGGTQDKNITSLDSVFKKGDLKRLLLAYLGSCYSDTQSSEYGRLTTKMSELGAGAVIGFDGAVSDTVATYFEELLFGNLEQGSSVSAAVDLAKAECRADLKGSYEYSNVDTARVYGDGSIIISGEIKR